MARLILVFTVCAFSLSAQGTISTFAGNGATGLAGDDGPATAAVFDRPIYVYVDGAGLVYVADENNNRIRKIDAAGIITTLAGNGRRGFAGDGGPAAAAALNAPTGICGDPAGNLYINDVGNQRIRRVDRGGTITTFAGNGSPSSSGDGGSASAASIFLPIRCAVNSAGDLFVAEQGAHRIRRITAGGVISTLAGTGVRGFSGDGGPAAAAVLDNPTALAIDYAGNIFFSDQVNHRIRRITPAGIISTVAGNGTPGFAGDGGPATASSFNFPGGLATDQSGAIYVADSPNHRIRRITPDGLVNSVAGNGTSAFNGDGRQALSASLNAPFGVAVDAGGALYIADSANQRIRRVSPTGPLSGPDVPMNGVVNAASFTPALARGGLATIFGRNLSPANGVVVTSANPWPVLLNGVSITVNGQAARVYSLVRLEGQEQISFQVPFEATGATAEITVENNGSRSNIVSVPLRDAAPGIFLVDGAHGAFLHADFTLVTAARPAARGEVLLAFLTGLGSVNPPVATGSPAPGQEPLARTAAVTTVTVGNQSAAVSFSGLAPGFIGLYQVNFQVPALTPAGNVDVVAATAGANSNTAKLEVR